MNERLTTGDLAEQLASQTNLDRAGAEKFIDAIAEFVINGIEANKSVKITGFGIFKVVLVRERESVHIQTGERFVIPAHHKLSFIPDRDMKDGINKPFAFLELVEMDDALLSDGVELVENEEDIDEIEERGLVNILPEEAPELAEDIIVPEPASESEIAVTQENEMEIKQQYYDIINPVISIETDGKDEKTENVKEDAPEVEEELIINQNDGKTDTSFLKKIPLWLWFLLLPLLIIVGVGAGTYAFWHFNTTGDSYNSQKIVAQTDETGGIHEPLPLGATLLPDSDYINPDTPNSDEIDAMRQQSPVTEDDQTVNSAETANPETVNPETATTDGQSTNWLAPTPGLKKEEPKRVDKPNKEIERRNRELTERQSVKNDDSKKSEPSVSKKVIPARVKITQGSTLRQLALEHYGDKYFWVYIWEYNKDKIPDPERVPIGLVINLPSPKTYNIDATSQSSINKAYQKDKAYRTKRATGK